MRNWKPDVEMDCVIAHAIVSRQFPEYATLTPVYLGRGWDNFCIQYPNGIVFRLPTRKEGARLLGTELVVLPELAEKLNIPIPQLLHAGVPEQDYPYPFIGYALIPGSTSDQLEWSPEDRKRAAKPLGLFLRTLHGSDVSVPPLFNLSSDGMGKAEPSNLMSKIQIRAEQLQPWFDTEGPLIGQALQVASNLAKAPPQPGHLTLVHGDLYPRHILADEHRNVTGVIDWGDSHLGDPAVDLSLAYTFFDADERPDFWAAYGQTPNREGYQIIILRAAMYGFSLMAYGFHESDHAAVSMGREALRRIVE